MKTALRTAVIASALAAAALAQADEIRRLPTAVQSIDALSVEPKDTRVLKRASQDKVLAALNADPRFPVLKKQLQDIGAIEDHAAQRAALQKLGPQLQALRDESIRKASVNVADLNQQLGDKRRLQLLPVQAPALAGLTDLPPVTVSSFPKPYTHKNDCGDTTDTWDFDGGTAKVRSKSFPLDEDCWDLRAGKGATVTVPAGVKKVVVRTRAKVEMHVTVASAGVYAEGWASFNVRIFSPSGATLSTQNVGGQNVNLPGKVCKNLKQIRKAQVIVGLLPIEWADFEDEIQDGDIAACSVDVPADVGTLEITPYIRVGVDADLSGFATASGKVTPRSLEVKFYR